MFSRYEIHTQWEIRTFVLKKKKMAWAFWFFELYRKDITIFSKDLCIWDLVYVSFFFLNMCDEELQQIKFLLLQMCCFKVPMLSHKFLLCIFGWGQTRGVNRAAKPSPNSKFPIWAGSGLGFCISTNFRYIFEKYTFLNRYIIYIIAICVSLLVFCT